MINHCDESNMCKEKRHTDQCPNEPQTLCHIIILIHFTWHTDIQSVKSVVVSRKSSSNFFPTSLTQKQDTPCPHRYTWWRNISDAARLRNTIHQSVGWPPCSTHCWTSHSGKGSTNAMWHKPSCQNLAGLRYTSSQRHTPKGRQLEAVPSQLFTRMIRTDK